MAIKKKENVIQFQYLKKTQIALDYFSNLLENKLPNLLNLNMPLISGWHFLDFYSEFNHKADVISFYHKPITLNKLNEILSTYKISESNN